MDDSTKPTEISITCLIPRFGAEGDAIARSQLHASFHVLGLEVVPEWVKWNG